MLKLLSPGGHGNSHTRFVAYRLPLSGGPPSLRRGGLAWVPLVPLCWRTRGSPEAPRFLRWSLPLRGGRPALEPAPPCGFAMGRCPCWATCGLLAGFGLGQPPFMSGCNGWSLDPCGDLGPRGLDLQWASSLVCVWAGRVPLKASAFVLGLLWASSPALRFAVGRPLARPVLTGRS